MEQQPTTLKGRDRDNFVSGPPPGGPIPGPIPPIPPGLVFPGGSAGVDGFCAVGEESLRRVALLSSPWHSAGVGLGVGRHCLGHRKRCLLELEPIFGEGSDRSPHRVLPQNY